MPTISGVHVVIFSNRAERMRAIFRDVLRLPSVDAGGGWLIFALPPAELAFHPARGRGSTELYLTCESLRSTMRRLKTKGVKFAGGVSEQSWGSLARMRLPDGSAIGLYQPKHARPASRGAKQPKKSRRASP
jgi:hypothetical protein